MRRAPERVQRVCRMPSANRITWIVLQLAYATIPFAKPTAFAMKFGGVTKSG